MSAFKSDKEIYSKGAQQLRTISTQRSFSARGALLVMLGSSTILTAAPAMAQVAASDAQAQTTAPAADEQGTRATGNPEEILVTGTRKVGGGLMKLQTAPEAISSITGAAIQEKVAAASPLQLVATVPGVNFGSSDAYGLSIRNFLSVRGLDQTEIGFLVENIPGLDVNAYFPYSEAWADNENIADISLTPGNSRLQDPIINASGGEFIMTVRNPRDEFGGTLTGSYGSYKGWRAFGGIDTGLIGQTGLKALASYSHTSAGNFVGPGRNDRDHVDFKISKDWAPNARSTLFVSYNHLSNARLPPLTLAQAQDGLDTTLEKYQYASTFVPGVTTNYYKSQIATRNSWLVAWNNDIGLSDKITLHVTPYYRHTYTFGPGETALNPASIFRGNQKVTAVFDPSALQGGRLFANSALTFTQNQYGINTWIEADLSDTNHLMLGYWHETWLNDTIQPLYLLDTMGNPSGTTTAAALRTAAGDIITGTNYHLRSDTNQLFIGDTQSFLDGRLKVSLGFKQLFYRVSGTNFVPGAQANIRAVINKPMPRILISFEASPQTQLYANVTTNARMPNAPGTYATTYNVGTGTNINFGNTATKPEYTVSSQLGLRYQGAFNFDTNVFYMHLSNHQVASKVLVDGNLISSPLSAGGETLYGIAAELSTHSYHGFSLYLSGQYLRGKFDENIAIGNDFLPTKGKDMVVSPRWSGSAGLRYENGPFFAQLTGKYTGKQYSTFMNDQSMPSSTIFDLSLGYRLPDIGALKSPSIRVNMTNLGNDAYIASVAGFTPNALPTRGINGTTIAGANPIYYVGAPLTVMATLRTDF